MQGQLSYFEQAPSGADGSEVAMSKSSDKPKKQQKQKPQKTLKERRSEKRAAKKFGSGPYCRQTNRDPRAAALRRFIGSFRPRTLPNRAG